MATQRNYLQAGLADTLPAADYMNSGLRQRRRFSPPSEGQREDKYFFSMKASRQFAGLVADSVAQAVVDAGSAIRNLGEQILLVHSPLVFQQPEVAQVPGWYGQLVEIIRDHVNHAPQDEFPVADETAIQQAVDRVRAIYAAIGDATPEPYFDVALDNGVDIYYDTAENELQIHVPPADSANEYCFVRLHGERSVERHPSSARLAELLQQVVAADGVPAE